jgi:chromosome segregation ATPase
MGVRIKNISNNDPGINYGPNDHTAHQVNKASVESRSGNKILELQWEALGKKLHKQTEKTSASEFERARLQLKEKDEQLKQAERKISELRKQLTALQEKQRTHKQQVNNHHQQQKSVKRLPEGPRAGGRRN